MRALNRLRAPCLCVLIKLYENDLCIPKMRRAFSILRYEIIFNFICALKHQSKQREIRLESERNSMIDIHRVECLFRMHNDKRNKYTRALYVFMYAYTFPRVTLHILIEKQESRLERFDGGVNVNYFRW